jgi:peptidoglycan hydrolase-like protein with peptidoglycan-binding domain
LAQKETFVTTQLIALGRRATTITIAGALTLSVLAMAPAAAHAGDIQARTSLREGAGMTGPPDARALAVQRTLLRRGYHLGAGGADGRFGPLTAAAVRRFQARAGLAVDGIVGVRTARALEVASSALREGVGMGPHPSERVRLLQQTLMRSGFDVGRSGADGRFGPLTAAAVRRMQRVRRVTADGVVGPRTRRVVRLLAGQRPARRTSAVDRPASPHGSVQLADDGPRTPATAGSTSARQTADIAWWTLLSALAALCAGAALAMGLVGRRRRKAAATVVSIQRDVYLEPRSSVDDAGGVRGFAMAAALTPGAGPEDEDAVVRWLVDDPRRPAPVWIAAEDVTRPVSDLPAGERVIGYVASSAVAPDHRTSQTQKAILGLEELCATRGWEWEVVVDDDPRENLLDSPGLRRALRQISAGRARGLVLSDSAGLENPLRDIGALLERLREAEAALVIGDIDLDTTTPAGRATASTLTLLGSRERERGRSPASMPPLAARDDERDGREP